MQKRTYTAPRGIRDVLPEELPLWRHLEATAAELARLRGFREIRPALLESTDLFTRSVGEVTDIVEKEMFTLERGDHSFTLRPEGTAGIARAYLEANYHKTRPVQRLFHTGPMFRYERPQKGRERMFTQFDVEVLGTLDPRIDAEVIELAAAFFEALGVTGLEVRMNSMGDGADRDRFREAVRAYVAPRLGDYSPDSQARFERNVLRILDSKDPRDVELNADAPKILDFLSDDNRAHFARVEALLGRLEREVVVDPSIVRGMDYYTRTVFEVHYPALGARSAVCGGGRYDHLLRDLGGPDLGAVGFAVGFTPTMLLLDELGLLRDVTEAAAACYLVAAGEGLEDDLVVLAEELRRAGVACVYDVEGKSVRKQFAAASKGGHRYALVLGPDELAAGTVLVKDLAGGGQEALARDAALRRVSS
ncbi:MAG: histidine--tRNA ligase [Planctomycetota bacterium]